MRKNFNQYYLLVCLVFLSNNIRLLVRSAVYVLSIQIELQGIFDDISHRMEQRIKYKYTGMLDFTYIEVNMIMKTSWNNVMLD